MKQITIKNILAEAEAMHPKYKGFLTAENIVLRKDETAKVQFCREGEVVTEVDAPSTIAFVEYKRWG